MEVYANISEVTHFVKFSVQHKNGFQCANSFMGFKVAGSQTQCPGFLGHRIHSLICQIRIKIF